MRQKTPSPTPRTLRLSVAFLPFLSACARKKIADPFLRGTVTELWTIVSVLVGGIVIGAVVLVTMNVLFSDDTSAPAPRRRK